MKLFKYPYLVQNEILNNTEFSDLLMFSFVSKRMKKLIESSSQMQRFGNVKTIRYDHRNGRTFVCIPFHHYHDHMLQIAELDDTQNDYFQLNVSEKMINFRIVYEDNKYCPVAYYQPNECESVLNSVHDYFHIFFGNSVEYYWFAHDYTKPIPQLQNLSACIDMPTEQWLDMQRFEHFISLCPILKFIDIDILNVTAHMSPDSKFFQAEHIKMLLFEPTLPANLLNFQGRQAFVDCMRCSSRELIEFVNKWKSGEAFDKLELMKIKSFRDLAQNEILEAIEAKYFDSAKEPPAHILPKVYRDIAFDEQPNTDPITSYTYVVRETDSRVASVLIHDKTFNFGVWDKTEDEFLRIME
ncbi:hypothetical protein B9Z55_025453 [Caenorhabditis nigoni]|uniref:F-box domain-containing protein n=1 Tax=Caenorhabditis nigoni TaxID=1611254 RepID=A0A2G5SZ79_9PELO|nr:hypothetical protein B9Z55_025453 [Caenorhabditis nigoni]